MRSSADDNKKEKFERIKAVCESSDDPFNLKKYPKRASDNYLNIYDVTAEDIIGFLMKKENAIHARKFFKKIPGAGVFATNWRKEFAKVFKAKPDLMREMVLRGGQEIREALLSEGFLASRHVDRATQREMKLLLKLMGSEVAFTNNDLATANMRDSGVEKNIASYLMNALAQGEVEQAKKFIANLMQESYLQPLISRVAGVMGKQEVKAVAGIIDNLVQLGDPAAKEFAKRLLALQPKKEVVELMNRLASFKNPAINQFILDNFGKMPHYVEMSHQAGVNKELKGLIATINLRASVSVVFFHPKEGPKEADNPKPPTPRMNG